MYFLSFRHARRKAKKIVSIRPPRPPTPPSPGSFVSEGVVEIGDPSRPSVEAQYAPLALPMEGFGSEPLLTSDPFSSYPIPKPDSIACPRQTQDRRTRPRSTSRRGTSSPKSLHNGAGSVQSKVSVP